MIELPLAPLLALAGALAAALALALVPIAIRLARRVDLLDHPVGWKSHADPTPYLGGAAILVSAALAAAVTASAWPPIAVVAGALLLAAVGTVDDAHRLHATPRVAVELASGVALWASDVGWEVGPEAVDLVITCIWVLAVVNALNLLDLMDGVATSAALASSAAIVVLAASNDQDALATGLAALGGACAGFLPYNLASPRARVFLGDGGTMPIGFLLAAAVPSACDGASAGLGLVAGCLLLGVPLFDAAVRAVLRFRRGVSLMTPGPDSLANRLLDAVGSTRRVALIVALLQALAGAVAIVVV